MPYERSITEISRFEGWASEYIQKHQEDIAFHNYRWNQQNLFVAEFRFPIRTLSDSQTEECFMPVKVLIFGD